jgi:hypothetical protein
MKDSKGHGSDPRGGGQTPVQAENAPFKSSLPGPHFLEPNDPRGAHSQGVQQVGKPVDMQRRQYEAIAGAISRLPGDISYTKGNLAQHFAEALRGTNPNFNADKFKTAATTGNMGRTQNKEPGMQSRHYEAVAGAIATLPPAIRGSVATHFAGELGRKNTNFNSQRFIKAAGG